jgi:hypothetical protein
MFVHGDARVAGRLQGGANGETQGKAAMFRTDRRCATPRAVARHVWAFLRTLSTSPFHFHLLASKRRVPSQPKEVPGLAAG